MSIPRIASAVALIAALFTGPASAAAPSQPTAAAPMQPTAAAPMQPTAKWNVDFGDAHCIATRNYGSADKPITLAFKPSPIGDVMQVSVIRTGNNFKVDQYPGTLTVGTAPPVAISVLGFSPKAGKSRVLTINLPADVYAPVRAATVIRVQSAGEIDQRFALSDMAPVARTLDRCVAELRQLWNIGDATSAIRTPPTPKAPLYSYFKTEDYPAVAARGEASGTVAMVTMIDEAGKVASCMVTGSSGYASLDAQSCAIITKRATFEPARGADGKPVKSGTTARIKWQLP